MGIHERVGLIGARLGIESALGRGTGPAIPNMELFRVAGELQKKSPSQHSGKLRLGQPGNRGKFGKMESKNGESKGLQSG